MGFLARIQSPSGGFEEGPIFDFLKLVDLKLLAKVLCRVIGDILTVLQKKLCDGHFWILFLELSFRSPYWRTASAWRRVIKSSQEAALWLKNVV